MVRAALIALIAGVVAAVYVVAAYTVVEVPNWAIGLFGGPERSVDRHGGLRVWVRPAAGGDTRVVEYPGLPHEAAVELAELVEHGGLVMKEALETDHLSSSSVSGDVELDVDLWRPEDSDATHQVHYLRAPSREALEDALVGTALPAGSEIAYERVEPFEPGQPVYWRTYLVASEVLIDGGSIASAVRSYDPYTNRPIVLLDFTHEGSERFCEITARIRGHKLAMIAGGRVRSAPIINGRICGGRASITMGASDAQTQEREADTLAAVLNAGPLPPGTFERWEYVEPADVGLEEWLGRLLFGAMAGLGFGLLMFGVMRYARPARAPIRRVEGQFPWARLVVTGLAPVALIAGRKLTLPGVNEVELEWLGQRTDAYSVAGLGVTPVILAFVLVELVALAVPRLRWRRHDPHGRVRLGQAVAALAIVLALVQGWTVASYLETSRLLGAELLAEPGLRSMLLITITLAAGTALLVLVAGIIREHGLGNGYAALLASAFVLDLIGPFTREELVGVVDLFTTPGAIPGFAGALVLVLATYALLRWRIAGEERTTALRVPACGVAPLGDSAAIVVLAVMVTSYGLDGALADVLARASAVSANVKLHFVIVVVSSVIWAWVFARPQLVERVARRGGLEPPRARAWTRATALSMVVIGGVGLVGVHARHVGDWTAAIAAPIAVMMATAVVLDIVDDARAWRTRLVPAGVLHQVQYVDVVERTLADAGIPAHFHASNIRTLLAFFGPWAPVIVLVPEELGTEARLKLAELLQRDVA